MKQDQNTRDQLYIINGQLIESILYLISIIVSIVVIIDQKKSLQNEERFLGNYNSKVITLINRLFLFLLAIWSIYFAYKSYEFSKNTNQSTSSLKLQIFASFLSIIGAIIELYVVATDFQNTNFQIADIENIEL